jgi:thioredoxin-related protein
MKRLIIASFILISLSGFSQSRLKIFSGSFNQAIDSARTLDKDIFFITKSISCPVFEKFKAIVENDDETVEFLNTHFIIYEYDMDKASNVQKKRLKKYYHSWRGFPQLYFIDKDEKLITDLNYPLKINQETHLALWKDYINIESNWERIKKEKRKNEIDFEFLMKYLTYRQIKYNPQDLIQIKNILDKYFKKVSPNEYHLERNWKLFQNYITIYSNPELFDLVARNKLAFQESNGYKIVSDYLLWNYKQYINWRKPEKVEKLAKKYPYNSVLEAKNAIELYRKAKSMQTVIKQIDN